MAIRRHGGEEILTEGLSSAQAAQRLLENGENVIPQVEVSALQLFIKKLWAPVPWLLELTILLEFILGDVVQALIFISLLVFNIVLSVSQEARANVALDLLRRKLTVTARVMRDGEWGMLPSSQLVLGDFVHIRQGDFVPADVGVTVGEVEIDQSALTGESQSVKVGVGAVVYSGSITVRGEASGVVQAVGSATYFGRSAQLVSTAQSPGNMERLIFGLVRALIGFAVVMAAVVFVDGSVRHTSLHVMLPFIAILLIASVPVALPATFAVATALGSEELSRHRVLVTRLAAIEEAASMEVLFTDKTGTLTENRLAVTALDAEPTFEEDDVIRVAAAASDAATEDAIDRAVLGAFSERGLVPLGSPLTYVPFEPATKRSEATIETSSGVRRAIKGAPQVVAELCGVKKESVMTRVARMAESGARILAVAQGDDQGRPELVGLIALSDPARGDASELVRDLRGLGIHVVMLTGDGIATATVIATQVGIGDRVAPARVLERGVGSRETAQTPQAVRPWEREDWFDVYAEVMPEDKLRLVDDMQKQSIIVGMTGDGVNDAPALKQAEVGIAVSSATDVAKAAASLVLTTPGLGDIVAGVEVSRRIHQRMLTYSLNKIIKTLQVAIFLGLGFVFYGQFVTSPALVVLLLFANDFVTMSLATDNVRSPRQPQRWRVKSLVIAALGLSIPLVLLSFGLWWYGSSVAHLHLHQLQTLVFVWLVTSGQATIYLVRKRHHFFHSVPSRWLMLSSCADLLVVAVLAWRGWLMTSIGGVELVVVFATSLLYLLVGDGLKSWIFRFAGLR